MRGFDTSGLIFIKNNVHDILYSIQTVFLFYSTQNNTDSNVLYEIVWCYAFLSAREDSVLINILKNDIITPLFYYLKQNDEKFYIPIIRIFGNIVSSNNKDIYMTLLKYDELYDVLMNIIKNNINPTVKKEACIFYYYYSMGY